MIIGGFIIFACIVMAMSYMSRSSKYKHEEYVERGMTLDEIRSYRDGQARRRAFENKAKIIGVVFIIALALYSMSKEG